MKSIALQTALQFADRGIRCFTLTANSKLPLANSSSVFDATTDRHQLREMFSATPDANLAAVPGPEHVVFDIDVKDGANGRANWRKILPDPPQTLSAKTPSGGRHFWFRSPIALKNTVSSIASGIDTRAVDGYIVLPPSRIPHGSYKWVTAIETEIADIPKGLLKLAVDSQQRSFVGKRDDGGIPEGMRNEWLFTVGCSLRGRGYDIRQVFSELLSINKTECRPPLPRSEVRRIAKSIKRYPYVESLTETGNAQRFSRRYKDSAIYVLENKQWYVPDSGIWTPDKRGICVRRVQRIASDLKKDAQSQDSKTAKEVERWAKQSLSKNAIKNSLELAQCEPGMSASVCEFDNHPMLLVLNNGVLNLESGKLEEHDLSDLHSKRSSVSFDKDATCPQFIHFLETIFENDFELIRYLQRSFGYELTGLTGEQSFTIYYGGGKNGKSTLLLVKRAILGDYACHVQPEIISDAKRSPHSASPSLARLQGARLVTTTETESNHRLGESLIKQLTGGDPVEARHLYKEPFEFIPTHKLILATNHKPTISGNDYAIWRRLHLVPFAVQIPDDQCIPNYHEFLLEEASGILNWALDGCIDWQITGLSPPDAVISATNTYRSEQDIVSQFLQEVSFPSSDTPRPEVYKEFVAWAQSNGEEFLSKNRLFEELMQRGCALKTVRGTRIMTGLPVGLTASSNDDWDD